MWRHLFRLLTVFLTWVACAAPVLAQTKQSSEEGGLRAGSGRFEPQEQAEGKKHGEDEGEGLSPNALPYSVAVLSSLLVMLIVCKPSRKA
ncbi:MAG TPA: hypothetical protein VKD72_14530 [Gemmataceae bacterium]|nr:hypothetical protein [Gemmataceae bacterium]